MDQGGGVPAGGEAAGTRQAGAPGAAPPPPEGSPPPGGYAPPPGGYAPPPGYPGTGYPPPGAGYPPPGAGYPPPGGYAPPPDVRTSGWAVASLVLSLVWLGGLGSLLAVVFGIVAKTRIRRAQGGLKGRGLSTAGIIIGCLGLVTATTAAVVAVTVYHAATTPSVESLGAPVNVSPFAYLNGVDRITVYSITPGAQAFLAAPPPGEQFVSVRMELCVTSLSTGATSQPLATLPLTTTGHAIGHFFIATSSGVYGAVPQATGAPNLYNGSTLASGSCQTGNLTFAVPADQAPRSLRYDPTIVNHYEWPVPGTS